MSSYKIFNTEKQAFVPNAVYTDSNYGFENAVKSAEAIQSIKGKKKGTYVVVKIFD